MTVLVLACHAVHTHDRQAMFRTENINNPNKPSWVTCHRARPARQTFSTLCQCSSWCWTLHERSGPYQISMLLVRSISPAHPCTHIRGARWLAADWLPFSNECLVARAVARPCRNNSFTGHRRSLSTVPPSALAPDTVFQAATVTAIAAYAVLVGVAGSQPASDCCSGQL